MGSIGTNVNEGAESVQKPLVREFKTQGRLNKAMMPNGNASTEQKEEQMGTHQTGNTQSYSNNLSRKSNALVANLARKHGQKMIANQVSPAAG